MTSMERELSRKVSINQVRETLKHNLEAVFGVELVATSLLQLQSMLATDGSAELAAGPHGQAQTQLATDPRRHTQTFSSALPRAEEKDSLCVATE
jgi:hypothetical protein